MNVAIVEDDKDVRHAIASMLEATGHHCTEIFAPHWDRPAQWRNIDVAIVDHSLGIETTGLTICRWLRDVKSIPALLLTAYPPSFVDADDVTILRKPIPLAQLTAALEAAA